MNSETLRATVAALTRIGHSPARILLSAAPWVCSPWQLPELLGIEGDVLLSMEVDHRRVVLRALAGRMALQSPTERAAMASTLWGLLARGREASALGGLLREAIDDCPGDGHLPADSQEALKRFQALLRDPDPLPAPMALQARARAPGIASSLAHLAYWLHCQGYPGLDTLVALPVAARWQLLEHYAADPLAAGPSSRQSAPDPLHLEQRLLQFGATLQER